MSARTLNTKFLFVSILFLIVCVGIIWIVVVCYEGTPPVIQLELKKPAVGVSQEFPLNVSDPKSGLRRIRIGLVKDGGEKLLFEKEYPAKTFLGGGKKRQDTLVLKFEPKALGISDGKGVLRVTARDYSWRHFWKGNAASLEKEIFIDTVAPEITPLTHVHNIRQGGAGLVIYRLSEPSAQSGVMVGKTFFPGRSGYYKDRMVCISFCALSYDQGPETEIYLTAVDYAGNKGRSGISYHIQKHVFRKDRIELSKRFFERKVPELEKEIPHLTGAPLLDRFLGINRDLRAKNYEQLVGYTTHSENTRYWKGIFLRQPKSARRAAFADFRDYWYEGHKVDSQVHMGIDLASVPFAPVPASNRGKVVFCDGVGIYGKTVILDHGFGLMSMYSHLSSIAVKPGQILDKGAILGRTGSTGLAGGDHLHFGIIIHKTFIDPVQWWDPKWIQNNITTKLETVAQMEAEGGSTTE